MEIKIIISDSGHETTTQITLSGQGSTSAQAGGQGLQPSPGLQSGSGMQPGDVAAGMAGTQGMPETASAMTPPPEVLRAAAAMGAQDAGPAPMLSGATSLGAPQAFIFGGSEGASMTMPDASNSQPAGAAPGSGMYAPTETVQGAEEST